MIPGGFGSKTATVLLVVLACLAAAGCATRQTARRPSAPPQPYLRVERAPDSTLSLQVAVRQLAPPHKRWPTLLLVGVTHLGETNYYHALQERLDRCDLVLYEGIGDAPRDPSLRLERAAESSLQMRLAHALGLVFQLEAIQYDRPHFKNSDLTHEQLLEVWRGEMRKQPSSHCPPPAALGLAGAVASPARSVGESMDELLGIMEGTSFMGVLAHTMVQFIAASPRLQATVKVVLIETMGALEGDVSESLPVSEEWQALMTFLIHERNRIVLDDVRRLTAEKRPPGTVAIFYGAAHMHDLEQRLAGELGYRPLREEWLTAFSINPRAAGVSDFELNWVRNLIQWQMRPRQPKETGKSP